MAWCRANIGIGTDFDKTSEAAARATHEDTSFPLPFSLKAPILSRSQVEASRLASEARKKAKDAAARVKEGSFPGLPYSLSTSLSGYLLDLLDSPAYANLTPSFLRDVFNPSTPNRNDIHYYSVAARTDKIGIWHPLWLPKLVLDGAESARAAQGNATPPQWRGNDGLVNVESSKWGTFLGTLDNCDHWELRGSSGLINAAATAKAVAEGVGLVPEQGKEGSKMKSWQWQDVYALVGKSKSGKEPTPPAPALSEAKRELESDNAKVLASLATWITRRLPLPNSTASLSDDSPILLPSPPIVAAASAAAPPLPPSPNTAATPSARMLYGAPTSQSNKPDKFNLERLALALCRKLHNEGL
jgi:triacylglycerol lipase